MGGGGESVTGACVCECGEGNWSMVNRSERGLSLLKYVFVFFFSG